MDPNCIPCNHGRHDDCAKVVHTVVNEWFVKTTRCTCKCQPLDTPAGAK